MGSRKTASWWRFEPSRDSSRAQHFDGVLVLSGEKGHDQGSILRWQGLAEEPSGLNQYEFPGRIHQETKDQECTGTELH